MRESPDSRTESIIRSVEVQDLMGQALPEKASSAWGSVATTLLARLLVLTCADEKGVPHVAPIPAGERPVLDDLGIHHDFDGHVEERNDLKVVKLVVADLA